MTMLYQNPYFNEVCYKGTVLSNVHDGRSGLKFRVRNRKITYLFHNQNLCCGNSKGWSQ